jgi:endoglucanase
LYGLRHNNFEGVVLKVHRFLLTAVVILFFVFSCSYEDDPSEEIPIPTEALEFVANMGLGINIGNALDSINNRASDTPAGETGWGNPLITLEFIQALKSYGFKTIRLPVTWAEYIGEAPDYEIDEGRMTRVLEVVTWILAEDMYCILNLHHDGGGSPKSWIRKFEDNEEEIGDMFVKVWRQIAGRFKGFSDKLILEAMNEVGFDNGLKEERYRKMNKLNRLFVDTVRASGSGNATRFLLVAGFWTDIEATVDPLFLMPQDTVENRLIVSVHYYSPPQFAIAGSTSSGYGFSDNWGGDIRAPYEQAALERRYEKLVDRFTSKGIPVIIGEYNATRQNKVPEGRIRWLTAVTKACIDNGMCPVIWDNGTGGEIGRNPPYEMRWELQEVWENIGVTLTE